MKHAVDAGGRYTLFVDQDVPEGFTEVSPRPSDSHIWQDGAWVLPNPRTTWRATATATRFELCMAFLSAGILTQSEAAAAARGEWPASFASVLAALPAETQGAAVISWGALTVYSRANPLWDVIGAAKGLTAAQIDTLFGWQDA